VFDCEAPVVRLAILFCLGEKALAKHSQGALALNVKEPLFDPACLESRNNTGWDRHVWPAAYPSRTGAASHAVFLTPHGRKCYDFTHDPHPSRPRNGLTPSGLRVRPNSRPLSGRGAPSHPHTLTGIIIRGW